MSESLMLIKPNVVKKNKIGAIVAAIEEKGLVVKKMKMEVFTNERAAGFYAVHHGKPFFDNLIKFMTSGPIVQLVVEHENCVDYVREVIGATDPAKAAKGTIRNRFGDSLTENAVHASDSPENAEIEIKYIFGS